MVQYAERITATLPIISDVRGHGLFIGAELVKDCGIRTAALPEIDIIVGIMKDRGYLLSTDGPLYNVLKIKPPMPFSTANADELCSHMESVLLNLACVSTLGGAL
jgi:4-aminobutyrate aminotransferase-like enzyme